jgi:protein-S-isoprenylcysteine O-methyltransferase Ste14
MTDETEFSNTRADRANTFPWPPVLLALAIAAAFLAGRYFPLDWPGMEDTPARIIGVAIGTTGLVLIVWAVASLWRHETTVMPDKSSTALVTTGPYTLLRNPIYLGEVMAMLGAAELTKNVWFIITALAFAALVTWLQIIPEERHLDARFGQDYRDYKARARRWI